MMGQIPGSTVRSSLAWQLPQVQVSTLPPRSPRSPAIGRVAVRRSAGWPQAGQVCPGAGPGLASRASRFATRASSAAMRSGVAFNVFQTGT